jgi:hypothetical protein
MNRNYRISRPVRRTVIFSLQILEKNNDECILILVIYLNKTGLLHTKISNHNIIMPDLMILKQISLSHYNRCTVIYKFGTNTDPWCIRRRSNVGHIFRGKKCVLWAGKYGNSAFIFCCFINHVRNAVIICVKA